MKSQVYYVRDPDLKDSPATKTPFSDEIDHDRDRDPSEHPNRLWAVNKGRDYSNKAWLAFDPEAKRKALGERVHKARMEIAKALKRVAAGKLTKEEADAIERRANTIIRGEDPDPVPDLDSVPVLEAGDVPEEGQKGADGDDQLDRTGEAPAGDVHKTT